MKVKRKHLVSVWLFAGVLLVGMIVMQGCETSELSDSPAFAEAKQEIDEQRHKAMIMSEPSDSAAFAEAKRQIDEQKHKAMIMSGPEKELGQPAGQTTCPIMGMAVDKNVYTEYKGKKVFFCCAGCETPFLENPEKYLSKLPQFKNQ